MAHAEILQYNGPADPHDYVLKIPHRELDVQAGMSVEEAAQLWRALARELPAEHLVVSDPQVNRKLNGQEAER